MKHGSAHPESASILEKLLASLPTPLVTQALGLAAERLELTPEKLSLLIVRAVNPDEILLAKEEAVLRGITQKTLKGLKDRGEV